MAWELARGTDLPDLTGFLRRDEWGHVAFSSRVHQHGAPVLPNPHRVSVYLNRAGVASAEVREALLVSRDGLVLPVLSGSASDVDRRDVAFLLGNGSRVVHSIMGLKRDVETVERSLPRKPGPVIDYHLMVLTRAGPPVGGDSDDAPERLDLTIRRARPRDSPALFPLQREYEKEEVLLDPSKFNSTAAYINLQNHVKREIVYYAVWRRRIVAKAGTNARGIEYDQLGGVYTVPSLRGRGVACALLRALLEELRNRGRNVCLFVKRDNPAAVRLYEKLGFNRRDDFRIAYYRS